MHTPWSPERWNAVKALFHELRDVSASERARRLQSVAADAETVREVQRLLAADADVGTRFDQPAALLLVSGDPEDPSSSVALDADALSLVGRRLGAYEVVRRIGEGGMGTVYEGHRADASFAQRVAIKTVWRDVDSSLLARRLRSERQILATLQHPNIASLIDGGTTAEGLPYLVMEFVDGEPIDAWCNARALTIAQRLDLFRQVCAAVAHAHRHLVVHRDLKPSNVFVNGDGSVKLLDFGVAKLLGDAERPGTLTGAGVSPFTLAFAAPEQVSQAPITTATDVYALGALLYLLLSGHTAIDAAPRSLADAVLAAREGAVTAPSARVLRATDAAQRALSTPARLARVLRGELDAIVMQAMRHDPTRRYASVDALADDVQRYLRGERVHARPDTTAYRLRTLYRRHRSATVGAAVTACTLIAGSGVALVQARSIRVEADRAERASQFLLHVVTERDAHFGDPFSRIGPQGRVVELVDSSLARVPILFADDPRIRAQLYTALGANLTASGQVRRAMDVLDSARTLARRAYGERSTAYIEATISAANATFHAEPPRVSAQLARVALDAIGTPTDESRELYPRALLALAAAYLVDARVRDMDSIARRVIAMEAARTPQPSMQRAWAWRLHSEALDGEERLAGFRVARAIIDSLGARRSVEKVDVQLALAAYTLAAGRVDEAEAIADSALIDARAAFGDASREVMLLRTIHVRVAVARRQSELAVQLANALGTVVDNLPDVNGFVVASFANARHAAYLLAGDVRAAERIDARAIEITARMESPLPRALVLALHAQTQEQLGAYAAAAADLERAREILRTRPDLRVMADAAAQELARIQGRARGSAR